MPSMVALAPKPAAVADAGKCEPRGAGVPVASAATTLSRQKSVPVMVKLASMGEKREEKDEEEKDEAGEEEEEEEEEKEVGTVSHAAWCPMRCGCPSWMRVQDGFGPTEMRCLALVAHNHMKPAMISFVEKHQVGSHAAPIN